MNRFLKFIEISFFILINILFASSFLAVMSFFGVWFIFVMLASIINESLDFAENVGYYAANFYEFVYMIAKIMLFPVLYNNDKRFPLIHKFFDLFYSKRIIHITIFVLALFIPVIECTISSLEEGLGMRIFYNMLDQLSKGYGILLSYLIMYFYLKHKNSQK